jgi:hypothetical protein
MKFWRNKTSSKTENPFRALNPDLFDKGAKINERASQLQRVAADGLSAADAVAALETALGNEICSMVERQPGLSKNEILDIVCKGVRDAAQDFTGAALPNRVEEVRELTDEEFNQLTIRILNVTTGATVSDSIAVLAKALGCQISVLANRPGVSMDVLVSQSQNAVAEFAEEARKFLNRDKHP